MSIEVEEGSAVWAYAKLLEGKKLRLSGWNNGVFIEMNKLGVFKSNIGDEWCHSDLRADTKWQLYEEPKPEPVEKLCDIEVDDDGDLWVVCGKWMGLASEAMRRENFGGYVHEINGQMVETGCLLWVWFSDRGEWSNKPSSDHEHRSHAEWVRMIEVVK